MNENYKEDISDLVKRIRRIEKIFENHGESGVNYNKKDINENSIDNVNFYKENYYCKLVFKLYLIKILLFLIAFIIRLFNNYREDEMTTPIEFILPAWINYKTLNMNNCFIAFIILKIMIDISVLSILLFKCFKLYILYNNEHYNLIYAKIELLISSLIVGIIMIFLPINNFSNLSQKFDITLIILSILLSIIQINTMFGIVLNINDKNNDFYQFSSLSIKVLDDFNLLLLNKKAYKHFHNFLRENDFIEGSNMLLFYIDYMIILNKSRIMKKSKECSNHSSFNNENELSNSLLKIDNSEKIQLKNGLFEKYIDKGSSLSINFPSELINSIHSSYTNLDFNTNNNYDAINNIEWVNMVKYCYNTLKNDFFIKFKESSNFIKLRESIKIKEKLSDNFIIASIIDDYF